MFADFLSNRVLPRLREIPEMARAAVDFQRSIRAVGDRRRRTTASETSLLLNGRPGKEGFVFHDGYNQPIHQAAPGLLGLLEGRQVVHRWKPEIVGWMDDTHHFFNHILHEFAGEAYFEPMAREIDEIRHLDAAPRIRNGFLFRYLTVVARELERRELNDGGRRSSTAARLRLPAGAPAATIPLDGTWTVRYRHDRGDYRDRAMEIPANWELLPDIENYAGSMRFTRTLNVAPEMEGKRLALCFHGVDYFADLWVNGHYLGGHEGYFAPFEFDVSAYLRYGEDNVIRLAVTSPNEPAGAGTHVAAGWGDFGPACSFPNRKTLVKGTLGHHDAKRGGAWSPLTSQDGNTGGVWNTVELRVRNPVHFALSGTRLTTLSMAPSAVPACSDISVRMDFVVENATGRDVEATLRVLVSPVNFDGASYERATTVSLSPGPHELSIDEKLAGARLWYPWDRGFPHLYSVTSRLEIDGEVQDEDVVETGFRTLSVTPIGESDGPDGAFVVNGAAIFVRGTNLLPTYWLSEYTTERIDRDLEMLREAGFNAILIHNLVAPRRFYRQANRHGFLVVQMFPLQWSYEQSRQFVERAARQVKEMAAFLYNEPAVVSYEVHNEPDMRTFEDLDNRLMDFELHAVLREADPHRWATTFSSGNHAYPGQFYPLRDDNSFETLPARFEEQEVHGRRISRHRNMPTEFGLQAMPNVELFRELVSEDRVRKVLTRIRTDEKWLAAGGEPWAEADKTIETAKDVLGQGSWDAALQALDWRHLWDLGELAKRLRDVERTAPGGEEADEAEVTSLKLAILLLEVLHYGAFKGENFWFGLWKPARTLEEFVASGQHRQYRLHKHAIETFLNAGVLGPIVGYFSFMFRDADWQAPTWGVVDAAWVPKKAYRAYLESNQPVRVSLPQVLRRSVKLPGETWFGDGDGKAGGRPWAEAALIASNDTGQSVRQARITVWLEDGRGSRHPFVDRSGREFESYQVVVDLEAGGGSACFERLPESESADRPYEWVVPDGIPGGLYYLKVLVSSAQGQALSTNSYELVVPDTVFAWLGDLSEDQITTLLDGRPGREGFHYWQKGSVVHRAGPGVRGFLVGFRAAVRRRVDLYEATQGEHFFRHLLPELAEMGHAERLHDEIARIRSDVISPSQKTSALIRYVERFVQRAERRLARAGEDGRDHPVAGEQRGAGPATVVSSEAVSSGSISPSGRPRAAWRAVGRDIASGNGFFGQRR